MTLSVRQLRPAETGVISGVFAAMTPEQRALLDSLRVHAQREGVRRLVLEIQADNTPALDLARRAGARMSTRAGNVQGTIELATSPGPCECATPLSA